MFKLVRRWRPDLAILAVFVAATIGLLAASVLSYEALILAGNHNAVLSCDINAVLSCASVANHWSSSLMGNVPNSFFGMIAMPVVMTIAVVLLTGARLPRWFMQATQIGVSVGLVFAGWMLYMSFAVIQVLCPWCLVTDVAMLVLFTGVTRYNVLNKYLPVSSRTRQFFERQYDWLVMMCVIVLFVVLIIARYGNDLFV